MLSKPAFKIRLICRFVPDTAAKVHALCRILDCCCGLPREHARCSACMGVIEPADGNDRREIPPEQGYGELQLEIIAADPGFGDMVKAVQPERINAGQFAPL